MFKKLRNRVPKSQVLLEGRVPRPWLIGVLVALVVVVIVGASSPSVSLTTRAPAQRATSSSRRSTTYKRHGALSSGCRLPAVPHEARRVQLPHQEPAGRSPTSSSTSPTRTSARSPPPWGPTTASSVTPSPRLERDQVFNNIRVNHTGLREAGYQCITCHADISHPGTQLEVARVSQNKMPICARCHDGVRLPDDCSICHVGGAPPEEINVPIDGQAHPAGLRGVPSRQGRQGRLLRLPPRPADAASRRLDEGARPHRRRPRQEHLRLVPPQGESEVLHRLPRPRDAASRRLADQPRQLRAQGRQPEEVRQVPRQGQLHQVPRPADAASGRVAVAALRAWLSATRASATSATAARSAWDATASSCRTAAPSSRTTRTTCTLRAASA